MKKHLEQKQVTKLLSNCGLSGITLDHLLGFIIATLCKLGVMLPRPGTTLNAVWYFPHLEMTNASLLSKKCPEL